MTSLIPHPALLQFSVGSKFYSETDMKQCLETILFPIFGIGNFKLKSCPANHDVQSRGKFPHMRLSFVCGKCPPSIRKKKDSEIGCCGFLIRAKLFISPFDSIHLVVTELKLPQTSRHAAILAGRATTGQGSICQTSQLTNEQIDLVKILGHRRIALHHVRSIIS